MCFSQKQNRADFLDYVSMILKVLGSFFPKSCSLKVDKEFEIDFSYNYIFNGGNLLPVSCYKQM